MPKQLIAGYIYSGNGLEIRQEDLKKLTHLNIAFGKQMEDCTIETGHLSLEKTVRAYKAVNPELKVLLSIGSGGRSAFSAGASTAENRKETAGNLARIVAENGLDGIDYDWEYPCCPSNRILSSPDDRENFTLLCAEIRKALDGAGQGKLFTIAAGGGAFYTSFTEMDKVSQYTDYIFLMTYDLRCGFHSLTGHHTNLYRSTGDLFCTSCKDAVEDFAASGVPLEKLVLGAAFYSRKWEDVPDDNHGFLQYVKGNGGYGPHYSDIVKQYLNQNGYTYYWDDEAKAPWLYDGKTFISYDNPRSISAKCEYIKQAGLGGMFFWEYNCDTTGELLSAIAQGI